MYPGFGLTANGRGGVATPSNETHTIILAER